MHFYVDFELLLALLTYSYPFRQIYSLNHYYWIALMLDKVARFDIKEAHPFFAHFHCIYDEYFGILDDFWMIFMQNVFKIFHFWKHIKGSRVWSGLRNCWRWPICFYAFFLYGDSQCFASNIWFLSEHTKRSLFVAFFRWSFFVLFTGRNFRWE